MFGVLLSAQVKIGDNPTTVGASSLLELESTTKALLITRVPNTASIAAPVNGMLIYDISSSCVKGYQNGAWTDCIGSNSLINAILVQIGNEGDSPNLVPSEVTVTQLSLLGVTAIVTANQGAYQSYIDANPNSLSSPATIAEVQTMITAVNTFVATVLTQIGNEGDRPNVVSSVVTTSQLSSLGVTGVNSNNQIAYQSYIDANPSLFSAPATIAEVQAMVTTVNTNILSILAQIGYEGDSPNSVSSGVTVTQLNQLPVTGVVAGYQSAYQTFIDTNPDLFSEPATVVEVQAMITTFNNSQNVLIQIGNEGDNPNSVTSVVTTTQLAAIIGVNTSNIIEANQVAYQAYIDANPNLFDTPATVAQVNGMLIAVNLSQTVLAQIGAEGDSPNVMPSVVTIAQLTSIIGVNSNNVIASNQSDYQAYIDANPNLFDAPATIAQVNAMLDLINNSANNILIQIGNEADSPNQVPSVVTTTQLSQLTVTGVVAGYQSAYQAYIDANPNLFAAPATVTEVQAMVNAVNESQTVLAQIGAEGDSPNVTLSVVTITQLTSIIGVNPSNVIASNQSDYQAYIDANPNLFDAPATVAQVIAMLAVVNASQAVLIQIGNEGDSPDLVHSVVTIAQINTILPAITGVVASNQAAYQAYIDANPNLFSVPATALEVQAMVTIVNTSNGTALVSDYFCSTGSTGKLSKNTTVLGVTQTITATVVSVGSYSVATTANGVTFAASGTFTSTGAQNIVLVATGTPIAVGNNTFTLNTTPNCSFTRPTNDGSSNGTAVVAGYSCSTGSTGSLVSGNAVSGVTQTITATVTNVGTYSISATANGVNFAASGTFTSTGNQNIVLTATGTPITGGNISFVLNTTPNCTFGRAVIDSSSNGSANVSAYACSTSSAGILTKGNSVSGVTQTITATVNTAGTYSITTTANGVTFAASGTFTGTGAQNIVLVATGTPTVVGNNTFTLNTTPNCTFTRPTNHASSNGTSIIASLFCLSGPLYTSGTMTAGVPVSNVTQTIAVYPDTLGTYSIAATANGVTFAATGTFTSWGYQEIILTATGTPVSAGPFTFALNTTPSCSFERFVFGNGSDPANPGKSCNQIKTNFPSSTDGVYWLDLDESSTYTPTQMYCDMTTSGGGWTLVLKSMANNNDFIYGSQNWSTSGAVLNKTDFNLSGTTNSLYDSYTGLKGSSIRLDFLTISDININLPTQESVFYYATRQTIIASSVQCHTTPPAFYEGGQWQLQTGSTAKVTNLNSNNTGVRLGITADNQSNAGDGFYNWDSSVGVGIYTNSNVSNFGSGVTSWSGDACPGVYAGAGPGFYKCLVFIR
jgi:hypothetical protein